MIPRVGKLLIAYYTLVCAGAVRVDGEDEASSFMHTAPWRRATRPRCAGVESSAPDASPTTTSSHRRLGDPRPPRTAEWDRSRSHDNRERDPPAEVGGAGVTSASQHRHPVKPDMDRQLSRSHQLRWTRLESTNGQVLWLELLELVSAEQANYERGAHQQQLPWALAPWINDRLRAAIALRSLASS